MTQKTKTNTIISDFSSRIANSKRSGGGKQHFSNLDTRNCSIRATNCKKERTPVVSLVLEAEAHIKILPNKRNFYLPNGNWQRVPSNKANGRGKPKKRFVILCIWIYLLQ